MNKMGRQQVESFSKIIARLEEWQNRPMVQYGLSGTDIQGEINAAKSRLISILNKIENQ